MVKDDEKWIMEQLAQLPSAKRGAALQRYKEVFAEYFDAEPVLHRKEGTARFHANTRLRKYVDKHIN